MNPDGRVLTLPSGTMTFMFTDIEGSTKLWEAHSEGMRVAVARHDGDTPRMPACRRQSEDLFSHQDCMVEGLVHRGIAVSLGAEFRLAEALHQLR